MHDTPELRRVIMLSAHRLRVLGKIAALDAQADRRAGSAAERVRRPIAHGDGWSVSDVQCFAGPTTPVVEEQQVGVSIAAVLAGTFQHRSPRGRVTLTPGALFLGNDGECYECGHEHAAGDRCIAFWFAPEFLERLSVARVASPSRPFRAPRIGPRREVARLVSRAAAGSNGLTDVAWDELAVEMAGTAIGAAASETTPRQAPNASVVARVTEAVRRVEQDPNTDASLARLAADASQSPYHYLRVFREITGVTPHQFVLRARLRAAAARLIAGDERVIDIALASGFGDVSNFNHAFRAEFGMSPRVFRARAR